ncbi:MAG: FkbM family methyltransferase [Ferruginibacter sp.]|nr:FkbM family methyltransferase [Ferruginibacter sp.]
MKWLENFKLTYRANKYKNKNDKGGISYLLATVQPGQTVFDIGAHKAGFLFWLLKRVGENGFVYAFEPQTSLFHYIKKLKALFDWENVTVEHLALSDSVETVTLFIPENKTGGKSSPGATIVEHKGSNDTFTTEKTETQTLDNYCNKHNLKPSFLKIDVEGNELKVLKGGLQTLKSFKPKIIIEIEARHVGEERAKETFHFLESLGYTGRFIHGTNYLPISSFNFGEHQNLNDKANYCNNFIFE